MTIERDPADTPRLSNMGALFQPQRGQRSLPVRITVTTLDGEPLLDTSSAFLENVAQFTGGALQETFDQPVRLWIRPFPPGD